MSEIDPQCMEVIPAKIRYKCICSRCSYTWTTKGDIVPKTCANPLCRSPYWNKLRMRSTNTTDNNIKNLKNT